MAIDQYDDSFWQQFPLTDHDNVMPTQGGITFDPSQASPNTGINGGADLGSLGTTPIQTMQPSGIMYGSGANDPTYDGIGAPSNHGIVNGTEWWNRGLPPSSWTPTPPNDFGLPAGQAPQLASGSGQRWDQAYFSSTFGTPKTPQELLALEQQIVAAGGKVLRNASGVAGKIQTPDGRIIDVINSAGAGGNGFQWLEGPGGGAGGGSNLASLGYGFGSSMAPWTEGFQAPDPNQIANDPYYKFQLGEGMKSIQNSAAARGTLLTGGTLKGLEQYGQGLASSFGDKAYDRGMGEYLLRRDNFFQNEDRPFSKNLSLANLGRPQ